MQIDVGFVVIVIKKVCLLLLIIHEFNLQSCVHQI